MGKKPYMEWYYGDWLRDRAVGSCDPATRGIWVDWLNVMHDDSQCGQLAGTIIELAQVGRCTPEAASRAIATLRDKKVADVTERNGIVTITNRRMRRIYIKRNKDKLRQREWREKHDVTPTSQESHKPSSSSSSFSGIKNPPVGPPDCDVGGGGGSEAFIKIVEASRANGQSGFQRMSYDDWRLALHNRALTENQVVSELLPLVRTANWPEVYRHGEARWLGWQFDDIVKRRIPARQVTSTNHSFDDIRPSPLPPELLEAANDSNH